MPIRFEREPQKMKVIDTSELTETLQTLHQNVLEILGTLLNDFQVE